jgi:hypothetical protein
VLSPVLDNEKTPLRNGAEGAMIPRIYRTHLPENSAGIGTVPTLRGVPRGQRAVPSLALDEYIAQDDVHFL